MKFTFYCFSTCLCLFLISSSAWAAPKAVNNCQTITEPGSYILKKSLTSSGDCIIIRTSFVTLDLDGQTITGDGSGTGVGDGSTSWRSIIVRNGSITNFNIGVNLHFSANVTVRDLNIWNTTGDGLRVGNYAIVTGNSITQSGGYGILISCCSVITNNAIDTAGIDGIIDSGASVISNNTIHGGGGVGINGGRNTAVIDNTIQNIFTTGVTGRDMLVKGNTIAGGTAGVDVICPSNVMDNMITWNVAGGAAIVTTGAGCNVSDNATN